MKIKWYYLLVALLVLVALFEVVNCVYDKESKKKLGYFKSSFFADTEPTTSPYDLVVTSSDILYTGLDGLEYITNKSFVDVKKCLKLRFK